MVSASSLLGAAGEHFVMCQLLRRGFIAALAPAVVPNCDIVVTDDIGDRLFAIQVKARRDLGRDGGWHMGKKHEGLRSPTLFYTFRDFGKTPDAPPGSFIGPARVVGETLEKKRIRPGSGNQARVANSATTAISAGFSLAMGKSAWRNCASAGWINTEKRGKR